MKQFLIGLALVALSNCDQDLLKSANDQFSAKFFNEVVKLNPGKSVVLSAFSVLPPLAQLSLAAEEATHDELLQVIGIPNDNATKEIFPKLNTQLRQVKGVDLKLSSRLFVGLGGKVRPEFAKLSKDLFGSEVKNVDFSASEAAAKEINTWVEEQTNSKIKNLVSPDSLSSDTRSVLTNAIYFKGKWKSPFDPKLTQDLDFHVTKDKTVKVPTLVKTHDYKYAESAELDAKLLELPYDGDESSLLIVLPNKIDGLAELQEKLKDPSLLAKAESSLITREVEVRLPKFKVETTTNLKDVLKAIGVSKIFDPEFGLRKLLEGEDLFVSQAVQKAFIEVNEEGAEAAAANEFGIAYLSAFIPETKSLEFHADHSFVFLLKEKEDVLFTGVYTN